MLVKHAIFALFLVLALASTLNAQTDLPKKSATKMALHVCEKKHASHALKKLVTRRVCASDGIVYKGMKVAQCVNNKNKLVFKCSWVRSKNYCLKKCKKHVAKSK